MNEDLNPSEKLIELTAQEIDQVSGGVSLLLVPIVAPASINWD